MVKPGVRKTARIETVALCLHSEKNKSMADTIKDIENIDLGSLAKEDREFLHDIANPLSIAGGLVEAFRDEANRQNLTLTEAQDRKLTKIRNALERMEKLISDRRKRLLAVELSVRTAASGQPDS
jgi:hypothetical protein